jgi:hypothetical protein
MYLLPKSLNRTLVIPNVGAEGLIYRQQLNPCLGCFEICGNCHKNAEFGAVPLKLSDNLAVLGVETL